MAAAAAALRHHLARPPPRCAVVSPLQRLRQATLLSLPSTTCCSCYPPFPLFLTIRQRFLCTSSSSSSGSAHATTTSLQFVQDEEASKFDLADDEEEAGLSEIGEEEEPSHKPPRIAPPLQNFPHPTLSVKEKKELASYAHSLGKKLKCQQVGKSGVTASVAASFVENLESNELLKLKVHGSCPGELPDVIKQLEEATGSVAVGQIGRSVILYRPSLSKMKKREEQSARKSLKVRPKLPPFAVNMQKKRQALRLSGHGRQESTSA